ncbi:MAG: hypothetical protein HYV07_12915 [Deltaproteobacteria bacterium]|nr:hypothetical protein [Deltaproteobacteria bacterium]
MRLRVQLQRLTSRFAFLAIFTAWAIGFAAETSWSEDALVAYFRRAEAAMSLPHQNQLDELAGTAGIAYGVARNLGEDVQTYARRVLKSVEPAHPNVAATDWVMALTKRFYADAGERAERLSRLSRDRTQRVYLEKKAVQAKQAVAQLSEVILVQVDGVDGGMAPLPTGEGEALTTWGAQISAMPNDLVVENLPRVSLANGMVATDAPRTTKGALREVTASFKQFQIRSQMMGQIDPMVKKGNGIVRAFIPGRTPAALLNEIVRSANEANMRTLIVMVTNKAGQLSQVSVPIEPVKKGKKPVTDIRCKNEVTMQACVEWILERKQGTPVRFVVE